MKNLYLKRIRNYFEFIAQPVALWRRNEPVMKKTEHYEEAPGVEISPDSMVARGEWNKKAESPRYSPAP